jgi:hypothetical protein
MHDLDKLHSPRIGTIGWVRIQSAKSAKVGENSTGVDTLSPDQLEEFFDGLSQADLDALDYDWLARGRPEQLRAVARKCCPAGHAQ